ncbi:MAG: nuclear transport factor 2 family protein [Proteobacteria bacterium]|nr:nuclear transport factor 2 family protein [Pseudomonadota bacterium]
MSAATPETELRAALQDLLFAVATADVPALQALFCDDATMHFPMGEPHGLIVGRAAIAARFERLFGTLRARLPGPPYARFKIEEFAYLPLDARHAAVYATLSVDGRIGRRTLLMRRDPQAYRILHLHASNVGGARGGESA